MPFVTPYKKVGPYIINYFCLNLMKIVNKSCLAQQIIEKIAFEIEAKIRLRKKCRNLQVSLFNEDVQRLPHHPGKLHYLI